MRNRSLFFVGIRASLLCAVYATILAWPAAADVTYHYTGTPFTVFNNDGLPNSYSCVNGIGQCRLSGTLHLADYLPADFSGSVIGFGNYMTDGINRIELAVGLNTELELATDHFGNIVDWAWFAEGWGMRGPYGSYGYVGGFASASSLALPLSNIWGIGDTSVISAGSDVAFAFAAEPGTWTVTPEPSSCVLLVVIVGITFVSLYRRTMRSTVK
jgi:hypothetical protein